MAKFTELDLMQMVSMPFDTKVRMSQKRIKDWADYFGEDKVYVSFSGGKDSLVLLHMVRCLYPSVPAVYCDTGLEYPELKTFVKTFSNVVTLHPDMTFREVIQEYGYPLVTKEVSQVIELVRQNIKEGKETYRMKRLMGTLVDKQGRYSRYNCPKWRFLLDMDVKISNKCCDVMKKHPFKVYEKETGRKGFIGTRALESMARRQAWMETGCNAYTSRRQVSKPLSFWTEQDIYEYITRYKLTLCSLYGEVVYDKEKGYSSTGIERTGCMWCAYGCHKEKSPTRFEIMKRTHPKIYDYIMRPISKGGLGYREIFERMNEEEGIYIHYGQEEKKQDVP